MKKAVIFLILASNLFAGNIKRPDLESYEKQKRVGAALLDFNNVNTNLDYNFNEKLLTTSISSGPISYSLKVNTNKNNELSHNISFSKNLKDLILNPYYANINDFYDKRDKIISHYETNLTNYSNLLLINLKLENQKNLLEKINLDSKIIDEKYKLGQLSEIDYQKIKLEEEIAKLALEENLIAKKELTNSLIAENVDVDNLVELEIENIGIKDFEKYILKENEKNKIKISLANSAKIHGFLPDLVLSASYDINNNSYGVALKLSKSFKLNMEDISEAKFNTIPKFVAKDVKDELKKYELLKNTYNLSVKKYEIMEKEHKINEFKYKSGQISYTKLLESIIKLNEAKENKLKSKNNLAIYILKRMI